MDNEVTGTQRRETALAILLRMMDSPGNWREKVFMAVRYADLLTSELNRIPTPGDGIPVVTTGDGDGDGQERLKLGSSYRPSSSQR